MPPSACCFSAFGRLIWPASSQRNSGDALDHFDAKTRHAFDEKLMRRLASASASARSSFTPGTSFTSSTVSPRSDEPSTPHSTGERSPVADLRRRLRTVARFDDEYEDGGELIASSREDMRLRLVRQSSDGEVLVVKIQRKRKAFDSPDGFDAWQQYIESWCESMELILNLPPAAGVASLVDFLEDSESIYVVSEHCPGVDLQQFLEMSDGTGWCFESVRVVVHQLLEAVQHLHAHSLVHRDLKLENVMIDPKQVRRAQCRKSEVPQIVKIIDFDTVQAWDPHCCSSGSVVGTDGYIAPEGYHGRYSPLTDIFALGVLAYTLFAGAFPFGERAFESADKGARGKAIRRRQQEKISWNYLAFDSVPEARETLESMLSFDEQERPLAHEVLEHPWLRGQTCARGA